MLAMSRFGYLREHHEENLRENTAITAQNVMKADPAFSLTVMTVLTKNNIIFKTYYI